MRDNRKSRTTVENSCIDKDMHGVQQITEEDKTCNAFGKDYQAVCKHGANYTAHVVHNPQSTAFIAIQSQQITNWGNIYSCYWISVADNFKRICGCIHAMITYTIIHISALYGDQE